MVRLIVLLISTTAFADINVYTSRKEHLVKPVFDLYQKQTGEKINVLVDKEQPLIQRLKSEGKNTKADIFMTVDAGNLWLAAKEGILAPVQSKKLERNIPAHLRDEDSLWFGLSVRARAIVYSKNRVKTGELSTYEDLTNPKWKKRLCLRTSKKIYNQSLVAMMVASKGEKKTEQVVSGWVKNLATNVFSNDTRLIKAIAAGQCDVGIVNSYYLGRLVKAEPNFPVGIFWPNQKTDGVHVNISGAGVVRYSKNRLKAQKFLEWLSSTLAQRKFAALNLEFPVNPQVEPDPIVKRWGKFKHNIINVAQAGVLQVAAVKLMDRAGYR